MKETAVTGVGAGKTWRVLVACSSDLCIMNVHRVCRKTSSRLKDCILYIAFVRSPNDIAGKPPPTLHPVSEKCFALTWSGQLPGSDFSGFRYLHDR
jgi:hypothetical protein